MPSPTSKASSPSVSRYANGFLSWLAPMLWSQVLHMEDLVVLIDSHQRHEWLVRAVEKRRGVAIASIFDSNNHSLSSSGG
jgi:hypothetical protein